MEKQQRQLRKVNFSRFQIPDSRPDTSSNQLALSCLHELLEAGHVVERGYVVERDEKGSAECLHGG